MKKILLTVLILCLLTVYVAAADFLASKNSTKYHDPSCVLAKNIKQENLVTFSSPEEASKAGFDPCKRCIPGAVKSEKH